MPDYQMRTLDMSTAVSMEVPKVETFADLPDISTIGSGERYIVKATGREWRANKVRGMWEINSSRSGGMIFERVVGTTKDMQAGFYYLADNNTTRIIFTLPTEALEGDLFIISGWGAGGYKIAQNDEQQIDCGIGRTEAGVNGYIESYMPKAVLTMTCVEQDKIFKVDDTYLCLNYN